MAEVQLQWVFRFGDVALEFRILPWRRVRRERRRRILASSSGAALLLPCIHKLQCPVHNLELDLPVFVEESSFKRCILVLILALALSSTAWVLASVRGLETSVDLQKFAVGQVDSLGDRSQVDQLVLVVDVPERVAKLVLRRQVNRYYLGVIQVQPVDGGIQLSRLLPVRA